MLECKLNTLENFSKRDAIAEMSVFVKKYSFHRAQVQTTSTVSSFRHALDV